MKSDQLYQEMKLIAEKLDVTVTEQNFRKTGISIKSGYCIVKGKNYFYIDKDLPINKKNEIIAEFLSGLEYDNIYIIPAVRDFLSLYDKPSFKNNM
ncbi:MAG: hypothetical protein EHM85_05230 [Desulfobacteraceae bacterium]|nr:MAG: hypothetical protein EHM85_05230 [Desulfobacteraceae bacterium]